MILINKLFANLQRFGLSTFLKEIEVIETKNISFNAFDFRW